MAEIRKFQPGDSEGIQKLVRDALGENIRPVHPSERREPASEPAPEPSAPAVEELSAIDLGYLLRPPSGD